MTNSIKRWMQKHHWIHSWGEVQLFDAKYFTFSGLFWGWKHRYQLCDHPSCSKKRIVEGYFKTDDRYYLRPGFKAEL